MLGVLFPFLLFQGGAKPKLVTAGLFGEEDEDDIFGAPKPKSP